MRYYLIAILLFTFTPFAFAQAEEPDETLLKDLQLSTEGPGLLEFIKQRTRVSIPTEETTPFVKQIASPNAKIANDSLAALVMRGVYSLPALRIAANDLSDKNTSTRARKAIAAIEAKNGSEVVCAVVRLLSLRKPEGTVEALLEYLPLSDDTQVIEAIGKTLSVLAYPKNEAHPALSKALTDSLALRRVLAVEALTRVDHPEVRPDLAKLLTDPVPTVKLRSALALAKVEDMSAIPVLLELMGDLNKTERVPVDDLLRDIAGETIPKDLPTGDDAMARGKLRDSWKAWWKKVDGASLTDEFRVRTLTESEQAHVEDLIKKLGDNNFRIREKASADLVALGGKVMTYLRTAARDRDGERVQRAEQCINLINANPTKRVPLGAARLAALRRSPGAAEAMIGYLPFNDGDEIVLNEIRTALISLAMDPNRKPDPALLKALNDPIGIRRSIAAEALSKGGGPQARDAIKKLLNDKDLSVRQQVAATLATTGEKDAIPVLIDLLAELPTSQTWVAQDVLHQIAGEKSPPLTAGETLNDREKYRDAWRAWWKDNNRSIDLARLSNATGYLGFTVVVEVGANSVGRVMEIDREGKIRWKIENLKYPVDATVLPGERVLITEWDGNRVSEYDFKGNVLWKREGFAGRATNAQRLSSGNTFISTTNELVEVDRNGKALYQINVGQGLTAAYRATNGEIIALRNDGQVVRYESTGKEIKSFPSKRDTSWTSGLDLARNGNILVSQPNPGAKVTEYTPDGKVIKEWSAPGVTTATKLNNGGILAASHNNKTVIELDSAGKKIWEYGGPTNEMHIFRARRR